MKDVSAGIIIHNNKILIARRKHRLQNGLWEFPGGKLEPGESVSCCLIREIKEELGMDITIGDHFMDSIYNYDTGSIRLIACYAYAQSAEIPFLIAHSETRWISLSELKNFEFAPADIPIKEALQAKAI